MSEQTDPVMFDRQSADKIIQAVKGWNRNHTPLTNRKAFEPRFRADVGGAWQCVIDDHDVKIIGSLENQIILGVDVLTVTEDNTVTASEGKVNLHVFWSDDKSDWDYSFSIVASSSSSSSSSDTCTWDFDLATVSKDSSDNFSVTQDKDDAAYCDKAYVQTDIVIDVIYSTDGIYKVMGKGLTRNTNCGSSSSSSSLVIEVASCSSSSGG